MPRRSDNRWGVKVEWQPQSRRDQTARVGSLPSQWTNYIKQFTETRWIEAAQDHLSWHFVGVADI